MKSRHTALTIPFGILLFLSGVATYGLAQPAQDYRSNISKEDALTIVEKQALWIPDGSSSEKVIYAFGAPWCSSCKALWATSQEFINQVQFRWIEIDAKSPRDYAQLAALYTEPTAENLAKIMTNKLANSNPNTDTRLAHARKLINDGINANLMSMPANPVIPRVLPAYIYRSKDGSVKIGRGSGFSQEIIDDIKVNSSAAASPEAAERLAIQLSKTPIPMTWVCSKAKAGLKVKSTPSEKSIVVESIDYQQCLNSSFIVAAEGKTWLAIGTADHSTSESIYGYVQNSPMVGDKFGNKIAFKAN